MENLWRTEEEEEEENLWLRPDGIFVMEGLCRHLLVVCFKEVTEEEELNKG